MKTSAWKIWDRLHTSFWFVPALMVTGAVALAVGMVALDGIVTVRWLRAQGWAYLGSPEGATAVLGAIAGSMITIAGVVFSLTLVALSLASSQFGPRLLRNFMRDTVNQVVLGAFVATFLYCLLVMLTIRRPDPDPFVPHLAVTVGVALAVASLCVLIYFIHHVAVSIQADAMVDAVGVELYETIDRLYPQSIGHGAEGPDPAAVSALELRAPARRLQTRQDGYLQMIDADALLAIACEHDLLLHIEGRPGRYVVAGGTLALVRPADRAGAEGVEARLTDCFVVGEQRTPAQDIEHAIGQLVEIAVRALSPGINDPNTAIACIDRLRSGLCRLVARDRPPAGRRDDRGELRVVAPPASFEDVADAAFVPLRQHGRESGLVLARLLDTIESVAAVAGRADERATLSRHARAIASAGRDALPDAPERARVERCWRSARRVLDRDRR